MELWECITGRIEMWCGTVKLHWDVAHVRELYFPLFVSISLFYQKEMDCIRIDHHKVFLRVTGCSQKDLVSSKRSQEWT